MKPQKPWRADCARTARNSVSSARLAITRLRFSIAFCRVKTSLALG